MKRTKKKKPKITLRNQKDFWETIYKKKKIKYLMHGISIKKDEYENISKNYDNSVTINTPDNEVMLPHQLRAHVDVALTIKNR